MFYLYKGDLLSQHSTYQEALQAASADAGCALPEHTWNRYRGHHPYLDHVMGYSIHIGERQQLDLSRAFGR